ncbi:plasma membrane calcium [Marasmius sp. AFHP31]|nr:plasma membrane calcium [Marasmius sp. AFHP31]
MLQRYVQRLLETGNPSPGDPSFIGYLNPDSSSSYGAVHRLQELIHAWLDRFRNSLETLFSDNTRQRQGVTGSATMPVSDSTVSDSHTAGRRILGAELSDIQDVDPTPFRFKPDELALMFHPKSYESLEGFGGVGGIVRGLGIDPSLGLQTDDDTGNNFARKGTVESHKERGGGQGEGTSVYDCGTVPSTVEDDEDRWDNSGALNASFVDRRRVYGENSLPVRKVRRLYDHMALAMWDNIKLTSHLLSTGGPISLVVLFEGVTTVVALLQVVAVIGVVSPIQAWQQERQIIALENQRYKREVEVFRNGVRKMVDFREVVVGDIALLEPGENVLFNGILLSGYNVKCDESAATGESDVIKKVTWADWTALRKKEKEGGKILLISRFDRRTESLWLVRCKYKTN